LRIVILIKGCVQAARRFAIVGRLVYEHSAEFWVGAEE